MTDEEYKILQDRIQLDCDRVSKTYVDKRVKKSRAEEIKALKAQIEEMEAE